MTQYIDKNAVVAEIERRQKEEVSYCENGSFASWADENHYFTLETIESFIDTLEVKEVDLEKELDRIWFDNKLGNYFDNDALDFAHVRTLCKHFFELGLAAQKEK